ncbi:MAG: hypothetical protein ABIG84_00055 [archaeon]
MRSKGFMHALEGILAALLLLSYTATIIQYPQSNTGWAEMKQKQVSREFISSFNDAGLSGMIVENKPAAFVKIARHFLGVGYSYGLYTDGLIAQNLIVGVLSNESVLVSTASVACASEGVTSEYPCYNATFQGHKFVLVDNDTNGAIDYDSIYFDSDKSGTYDAYEGPRTMSSTVNASGEIWIFSSVVNATLDVEFIRGEDVVRYRDKLRTLSINGREINISVRARTNESDIMDLDVLIIPRYMDLVKIKSRLNLFLDEGKSIIEVANITKDNLDEVQREIFGLQYLENVDIRPSDDLNISIVPKTVTDPTNMILKYFNFTNIMVNTLSWVTYNNLTWTDTGPNFEYDCYLGDTDYYIGHVNCTDLSLACATYTASGLIGYVNTSVNPAVYCKIGTKDASSIYHLGEVDVRKEKHFVLVMNASNEYDRVVVDSNGDHNLTNDAIVAVDDSLNIGSTDFMVKKIDERGRSVEIRPVSRHKFVNMYPDKLYSVHNDTQYIVLEQDTDYNNTVYDIGEMLVVNNFLSGLGVCSSNSLLSGSGYRYNSSSWNLSYAFTITNVSKGFNVLNIDLNQNNKCNDVGEGPFYTGDMVRIGPEYYKVDIAVDGTLVNWTLAERWRLPVAIVNHKKGLRKAAWIKGNVSADDEWHILRSLILWSVRHTSDMVRSPSASGSVLVKSTFIEDSDMFQPYKVYFRSG